MRKRRVTAQTVVAVRFAESSHIQPVPSPALTELRTRKQCIDQLLNRRLAVSLIVDYELLDIIHRWRQANQVI